MPVSDYFGGVGAGLVGGILNGALGFGQTYYGYKLNEQAANNADARHRALYNDLYSPQAKIKQLQDAGLSVGLMYGGQGAGGQTAPTPQGAGANTGSSKYFDLLAARMNQAQIDNLNADTRQKNADAEVTEETGKESAYSKIAEAYANAGLADASRALKESETTMQDLQNYITEQTTDFTIKEASARAEKAFQESWEAFYKQQSAHVKADIDWQTKENVIRESSERVRNLIADTLQKQTQAEVNRATVESLLEHISIDWRKAAAEWKNAETSEKGQAAQQKFMEDQIEQMTKKLLNDKEIAELQSDTQKYTAWVHFAGTVISAQMMNLAILGSSIVNKIPLGSKGGSMPPIGFRFD